MKIRNILKLEIREKSTLTKKKSWNFKKISSLGIIFIVVSLLLVQNMLLVLNFDGANTKNKSSKIITPRESSINIIFQDDFESYPVNTFPTGYTLTYNGAGDSYQKITDTQASSGTQSFTLTGTPSWSAVADKQIQYTSDILTLEAKLMSETPTGIVEGGKDNSNMKLSFANPTAATWGRNYASLVLSNDGGIYLASVSPYVFLGNYTPFTWYDLKMVVNITGWSVKVYLDDIYRGESSITNDPTEITHVRITSAHQGITGYIDDLICSEGVASIGDSDINIITPENKTYIEPMSGYYPATYGFENEPHGTKGTSLTFLDEYYGHSPGSYTDMQVYDGPEAGHAKHLNMRDSQGGTNTWGVHHIDNPQSSGTIEFYLWANNPTTVGSPTKRHYMNFRATDNTNAFRMMVILSNEKLQYYDGSSWQDLAYTTPDVWYHHSISFDCEAGVKGQFTWIVSDEQGTEIGRVDNHEFENDLNTIDEIYLGTHVSDYRGTTKWDAFGFSWDPNYNIGDNLDEGLLIGYETEEILNWIGYSLDGQNNVTISGNYTIPVPVNGTHTIQVFGNDSIGTMYESNLRYFTYGTISIPGITIISPTANECFNSVAPDFQISISGASINTTWYTIDNGFTNITFSGQTGTIDQTEWDKKGEGDINLRFYVNDTLGNSSYSDVTLKKDTLTPLITIHSPLENELFGKTAPKYNLTIVESNIDLMWYTLDYGVTNITHMLFNGTINQSEWNKIGNGTADIRFYVLDRAGNAAYADITVRKEISDPIVIINAPLENEVFGFTAPFFNVSVIEPDFDSMWYTLDDGINNVTASGFTGGISQTEWNKKGSGMIIIRFYANDTLGNNGYAEIAVEKDITDPTIQVNTPIDDAIFGYNAPSYDISITEPNLDSMWYTLDNGLTNIPIFSFTGDIDQTEWNKKGSGTVSIRFYANDTMGNTDYTEVIVVKDLIDPIVAIISPNENEVFGAGAPIFEISITELNLDTMWYTLDNGLTNIPLFNLIGIIDQTEWNKKDTGDVTIKFFANDKAGNEDYAEVTVFKDIDIPIITIYSPKMDGFADPHAPSFNISVQEPNIDLMWYTLDYGITNYYFTEVTGFIDQLEWNEYGNGSVIIRFYVKDEGGNEAFSEVLINKDIYAPIITIETPELGEQILEYAPIYSISIQEPNLDNFWYSIDNGNTNITITELIGVIDAEEWDALPNGPVIVRFYAQDQAGNIGTNSVIVTKITTDTVPPPGIPGYDPYLLIGVISVISVIFFRKRFKS